MLVLYVFGLFIKVHKNSIFLAGGNLGETACLENSCNSYNGMNGKNIIVLINYFLIVSWLIII